MEKIISGTENNIEEKRRLALEIITMFRLPENTAPEKFLYDCLLQCGTNEDDQIIKAALTIHAVNDSHKWISDICKRVNESEEYVVRKIVDMLSSASEWEDYIKPVKEWLEKRIDL